MSRPQISLCMIVKNEAEYLDACLTSVQGAVDEIIVVDTGSDDGSVELAMRHGARVIREPWRHDFARARNAGLDRARGEWILVLDADERLEPGDAAELRSAAKEPGAEAVLLQLCHEPGAGQEAVVINPVVRLFRNRPEYRFEGRVHEQITPSICRTRPEGRFIVSEVRVRHLGYHPETVNSRNKVARNLRLLRLEIRDHPDQPFHWYNLGVEYVRSGRLPRALACFRRARRGIEPERTPWAHLLYKTEARCLYAAGQPGDALALIQEGLRLFPKYTDLYCLAGLIALDLGRWGAGTEFLRKAVELGPAPSMFHREERMGTYLPCFALGAAAEQLRVYDAALMWFKAALTFQPALRPAALRMAAILRVIQGEKAAAAFLETWAGGGLKNRQTEKKGCTTLPRGVSRRLADADRHLCKITNSTSFQSLVLAVRLEIARIQLGEVGSHVL
ncbi:MAG TPA: glycosyltransferase [Alicyclobacillus sp.]|nr:glycosyltransferase [Alicyclobacillus sp.]